MIMASITFQFLANGEVSWTVNAMLAACSFIQSKWTEVQYDVLKTITG